MSLAYACDYTLLSPTNFYFFGLRIHGKDLIHKEAMIIIIIIIIIIYRNK